MRVRRLVAVVAVATLLTGCRVPGVVGDSVTHDARQELKARGAVVLSAPGVDIRTGRPGLRRLVRAGHERIVVALGLMDVSFGATRLQLERRIRPVLRDDLAAVDCVIWVDLKTTAPVHANWPERSREFNELLTALAGQHGALVARWSAFSVGHPDWFRPDGIHLRPRGQAAYARFLTGQANRRC